MNTEDSPRGTRAHAPGPDWSHLRETVLMMELAVAQVEAAMTDSNASVDTLTGMFTTMASTIRQINARTADLDETEESAPVKRELLATTAHVAGMVNQAIIAFQFYDRLTQRLSHVNHSLAWLAELVGDEQRIGSAADWAALQQRIRARYSMPEEIEMFEAVLLRGLSVEQAIREFMDKMNEKSDDIELF
ncbi:hypothetical protein [Silanimonas sp.]|uniref:hypothetical protein n=1 Tax=Silanimonas sp. TaxID=1929290 RepID=UPI001BBF2BC4|nr:hypothetical protein [Silanimonas sp.]MBS3896873.1 hypothetical protein [Silanimonas sp.]MBS3924796.1 hypothetical protein [Xanthomonadaceae bacterium]